jgi:hypothetical protein
VKLLYGMLADYVAEGINGKVNIIGVFDTFFRSSSVHAEPLPVFFLVAAVEAHVIQGTFHATELRLLDGDGHDVVPRMTVPKLQFMARGPGLPLRATLIVQYAGLLLPDFGTYEFDVVMDGKSLGTVPLHVAEAVAS